jgi:hypothetical protein
MAAHRGSQDDRTAQRCLRRLQGLEQVLVTQTVGDNHEVNVARGPVGALRDRAVDESRVDVVRLRRQRLPEGLHQSHGLHDQSVELSEHWGGAVRLVVLLVPAAGHGNETAVAQAREHPMRGPGAAAGQADQLGALEATVRLAEKEPKRPLLNGGKSASARLVCEAASFP